MPGRFHLGSEVSSAWWRFLSTFGLIRRVGQPSLRGVTHRNSVGCDDFVV